MKKYARKTIGWENKNWEEYEKEKLPVNRPVCFGYDRGPDGFPKRNSCYGYLKRMQMLFEPVKNGSDEEIYEVCKQIARAFKKEEVPNNLTNKNWTARYVRAILQRELREKIDTQPSLEFDETLDMANSEINNINFVKEPIDPKNSTLDSFTTREILEELLRREMMESQTE